MAQNGVNNNGAQGDNGGNPFNMGGSPGVRAGEVGGGTQSNFDPQFIQQIVGSKILPSVGGGVRLGIFKSSAGPIEFCWTPFCGAR